MENAVGHVATWVTTRLRDETFTDLGGLRAWVGERVDAYNRQPFQECPGSRASVFAVEERPRPGRAMAG